MARSRPGAERRQDSGSERAHHVYGAGADVDGEVHALFPLGGRQDAFGPATEFVREGTESGRDSTY
jgi:hypothetical protein